MRTGRAIGHVCANAAPVPCIMASASSARPAPRSLTINDRKFNPASFRACGRWRRSGADSALPSIEPKTYCVYAGRSQWHLHQYDIDPTRNKPAEWGVQHGRDQFTLGATDCFECAPWIGGAFQWVKGLPDYECLLMKVASGRSGSGVSFRRFRLAATRRKTVGSGLVVMIACP